DCRTFFLLERFCVCCYIFFFDRVIRSISSFSNNGEVDGEPHVKLHSVGCSRVKRTKNHLAPRCHKLPS
uniref:Uncharacterized protein n=1 Tax=Anopheles albimanus TaxID=7167 RepID=A0A182FZC8_ANOAL